MEWKLICLRMHLRDSRVSVHVIPRRQIQKLSHLQPLKMCDNNNTVGILPVFLHAPKPCDVRTMCQGDVLVWYIMPFHFNYLNQISNLIKIVVNFSNSIKDPVSRGTVIYSFFLVPNLLFFLYSLLALYLFFQVLVVVKSGIN